MLTGAITKADDLAENDFRRKFPRFQGSNMVANLALMDRGKDMAVAKGCPPGQVALA